MPPISKMFRDALPPSMRRAAKHTLAPIVSRASSALAQQTWAHRLRFMMVSRQKTFSGIYDSQAWGSVESGSGTGSELRATENIRAKLPEIVSRLAIRSLLDAPCGDWNWMQHIHLPVAQYYGIDIVPGVIESNRRRFPRRGVDFQVRDLTTDPLPKVQMIMCRDCWVHLAFADIAAVLENFKRTGAEYLLVNNHPQAESNRDQFTGVAWRLLDLTRAPFNFPPPLESFPDGGDIDPNIMCLWKLQDLPAVRLRAPA